MARQPKKIKAAPTALYSNEAEALSAPGVIWRHYKGGIYRSHFKARVSTDRPLLDGEEVDVFEHIHPNEHGMWVRPSEEWHQEVDKPELDFKGRRFTLVKLDGYNPQTELFSCDCHSADHMFTLSYEKDEDPLMRQLIMNVFLSNSNSFWERVVYAFKYVFGQKQWKGAFDEVLLSERQLRRMKDVVDNALDDMNPSKEGSKSE